jgi:hypothetical protein
MGKSSVTVKAAWIGGGFLVIAAVITGVFSILKPDLPSQQGPIVNVYPQRPEDLDPRMRTYFQYPAFKSLALKVDAALTMQDRGMFDFRASHRIVNGAHVVMLEIAGEIDARIFNLSEKGQSPFTVFIATHGRRYLLAVEKYENEEVQIRTFRESS